MAKIYQGIQGPFSGRVGTVVGYVWKGRPCMRSHNASIHYPNTHHQQAERNWFLGMVRFAARAKEALRLGFAAAASREQMTEGNYFVQQNKPHFHRTPEGIEVDYRQLAIAEGPLPNVDFKAADFLANEVVSVDFDKRSMLNRASTDDSVYLYAYCPACDEGMLSAPTARKHKNISVVLPEHWSGHEVHLWGFAVNREGVASRSAYVGLGRVNHYEERGVYIPYNKDWQDFVDMAHYANGIAQPAAAPQKAVAAPARHGARLGEPPEVP